MSQQKKFPISISDFKTIIEEKYLLIDKTLLIKDIINDSSSAIVLTRPRRFGKTLNLSMLYYFFRKNHSDNKNLFQELNISKDTEFCNTHQGQYPVIFISFKEVKKNNFDEALAHVALLIKELYAEHRYLLEDDTLALDEKNTFTAILNQQASRANIENAIKKLSDYLQKKFDQKPIILIDEYDTPIQTAYLKKYYDDMVSLMRSIFGAALKDNPNYKKAVITGITRVAQESLFSGINNITIYSVLREKYGQYFGFTEEEVLKLSAQGRQTAPIELIREWYNGYQIGQYTLYNPWSIVNCLDNNEPLTSYWVHTSSNDLLALLIKNARPTVKQQLEELLQGKTITQPISENLIFKDLEKKEAALWSLLLYTGYLKVLSSESQGPRLIAELTIPNKEIRLVYDEIIDDWLRNICDLESYNQFLKSLSEGNIDLFKEYLSSYLIQTGSYFDFPINAGEQMFHVFLLGLVMGLKDQYSIHSNKETGLGRCDVLFIPKNKSKDGIIIEFKTSETPDLLLTKAQQALDQIKDKGYIEKLKQEGIATILTIGLSFCGKQLELVSKTIPDSIKN